MSEEDRWRRTDPANGPTDRVRRPDEPRDPREPPGQGPSAPRTLRFNPLSTGIGVALGVGIPIVVFGYTRPSGVNNTIVVIGAGVGLIVGLLAGLWVAHRGGDVWRGPQL